MELEKIQPWDLKENLSKKMVVYSFIFPEGHVGILDGYNRGMGPISFDLEDYEEPIGIYMDNGDYYSIVIDLRDPNFSEEPTFNIAGKDFYYEIKDCGTSVAKIDPATGIMIDGEVSDVGKKILEKTGHPYQES